MCFKEVFLFQNPICSVRLMGFLLFRHLSGYKTVLAQGPLWAFEKVCCALALHTTNNF
jgi:hypothetical protein